MSQSRVFQCPNCKEYISTDATTCRFCSTPIDAQSAQAAADAQALENKRYRKKQYARHIWIGAGVFVLGLAITVGSYIASEGGSFVLTYGLMLVGGGDLIYGLAGWLGELKKD
jgi:hypothetical protein